MDYKIEKQDVGDLLTIDLPLEIGRVDYSFEYYDNDLKRMRSTHPNFWVVIENDLSPKGMEIQVKEFKEVENAIEHAKKLYIKYLRQELNRVIHSDEK